MTGYISGGSMSAPGFVSVTRDGGVTWHATAFPRWMSGVGGGSAGKVLAVGDYSDRVPRSTDFGSSWTTGTAAANNGSFESVSYLPSGRAVLLGQKRETPGGDVALIATSDDSATWTERYAGPFYAAPDEFSNPPTTIAQMLSVDSAAGVHYALGNEWNTAGGSNLAYRRPLLFTSIDNGSSWTTQTASGLANAGFPAAAISVVDAATAFAVGGPRGFYKTTNYGASWSNLQFQKVFDGTPGMTAFAVDALDANRIAAVGDYGLIATTATGGPPWAYRSIGGGNALRGIKMLDATRWVVTGDNETILRTSDGGATWTGPTSSQPPAVSMSAPAAGFPLTGSAVTIAGTSSDTGVGVAGVEVLIRRADSMSFNGVGWAAGETWLPAETTNGWATWNLAWTPDAAVRASGQIVTVSARAKDGVGNASNILAVSSGAAFTSAITLAGGAQYATSPTVPVSVSAAGATHSRWSVNGAAFTAWASGMPSSITLPAGDGVKNVTVEFSANGGATTLGSASDSITLHMSVPSVTLATPSTGFSLTSGAVNITGTASDTGGSVSGVQVLVRRADGMSWNGSAWVAGDTWVTAATSNSFATWNYSWTPDAGTIASGKIVTVSAKAADAAGLSSTTAGVSSGVPVVASAALAGGAVSTTSTIVPVAISASGANAVRWSGDVSAPSGWQPYPNPVNVTLADGDGPKTVTFEFSTDGGTTVSASTSDAITLHTSLPLVTLAAPGQGYSLQQGAVAISGTASDVGARVARVELLISRSDGVSWNGTGWVPGNVRVDASTSSDFANWQYSWTPDTGTATGDQLVTISARATDEYGLVQTTPGVVSHSPITAAVSLAGGAHFTSTQSVAAEVSAPGAKRMRWSVDGEAPSGWATYTDAPVNVASVTLPGADGVKEVTFEFSLDAAGDGVAAIASDAITLDQTPPTVTISDPAQGFPLSQKTFGMTAADGSGSGVSGVRVRISKPGVYWNGLGWQAAETWLPATEKDSAWQFTWTPDVETATGIVPVTVTAVADDNAGNASAAANVTSVDPPDPIAPPAATEIRLSSASTAVAYGARPAVNGVLLSQGAGIAGQPVYLQSSSSASGPFADTGAVGWTSASGAFTFTVAPKAITYYRVRFGGGTGRAASAGWVIVYQPRAYLGAPYAPTTVARTKTFTSYGSLKPRHTAGKYPVKITAQRYEKQANGTRKWVTRKTVAGKSSNYLSYTRYSASLRLPYPGRWRLRASHSDAGHAASYSAYRYITVK